MDDKQNPLSFRHNCKPQSMRHIQKSSLLSGINGPPH